MWSDVPKLLQGNGDFDSVGGLGGVKIDVGSFLVEYDCHFVCDVLVYLFDSMKHRVYV